MNSNVNKRKLEFFGIISEGIKIFFSKTKEFSLIGLITIIPISLLLISESLGLQPIPFTPDGFTAQDIKTLVPKILLLIFVFALQAFITLIASMSIAIITEAVVENKPVLLIEVIKLSVSKWGRAFVAGLLAYVITYALSLLFIIPGIIYSVYYIFFLYTVTLRDKDGMEALNYSKTLVQGQWWRVFWILIGFGVIFAIANGIVSYLISQMPNNSYLNIIPTAFTLFSTTIFGIINVVLFLNNDFVYHRNSTKRKENEKREEYAPTIEEYLEAKKKKKASTSKRSTVKKIKPKTEKSKTVVKRNTRKQE